MTPVPQQRWTSDTALYTVASRVPGGQAPAGAPRAPGGADAGRNHPQTPLLDLIGALFGGLLNVNPVSPVQAAFDQQLESLQSAPATARLVVTRGQNRAVDVSVTKSSRHRS